MAGHNISFAEVRMAASGKWTGIHSGLGISLKTTSSSKHTPCPACGGRDRFRVLGDYAETGRWICSGGGDQQMGDGFSLLGHVFGWDSLQQLQAVADYLGLSRASQSDRAQLRAKAEKQAADMAEDARRKDEQARRDCQLLDSLAALENAIEQRKRDQRTASGVDGRYVIQPSDIERKAAQALNVVILEAYANG